MAGTVADNLQELRDRLSVARNVNLAQLIAPDAYQECPRVWIVGGGPSLRGFDWDHLRGDVVIGCNRAFELPHVGLCVSMDTRFLKWVVNGELGESARDRWRAFLGPQVFTVVRNSPLSQRVGETYYVVERHEVDVDRPRITTGLGTGSNSGYMALQLAWALGAKTIHLLGFDMRGGADGRQAWYHAGYPDVVGAKTYLRMIEDFDRAAPRLAGDGVRVTNYGPDSAIRCFRRAPLEEAVRETDWKRERPIVIGYYTSGTGYEAEARAMVQSARAMGLETDVQTVAPRGGWQANTLFKAEFVRAMMEAHPGRALLWVDADARFRRYPALFDGCFLGDFACHFLDGHELLSGTLYVAPTDAARTLVDTWCAQCQHHPDRWDQKNLQAALAQWTGTLTRLPAAYCRIFDHPRQGSQPPVIEHLQASRRLKREVGA